MSPKRVGIKEQSLFIALLLVILNICNFLSRKSSFWLNTIWIAEK